MTGVPANNALALWIDGPTNSWLAGLLSVAFTAGSLTLLILFRLFTRAVLVVSIGLLLVVGWWVRSRPVRTAIGPLMLPGFPEPRSWEAT